MTCVVIGCSKASYRQGYCNAHHLRLIRHGNPTAGGAFKAAPGVKLAWVQAHANFISKQCLYWPYGTNDSGLLTIKGRLVSTSRHMCELAHGPAPTSRAVAAHSCRNGQRGCINPNHLRWATQKQNCQDKIKDGTMPYGEKCGSAKITITQAKRILQIKGTTSQRKAATKLGVSRDIVRRIWLGRTWSQAIGATL